MAVTRSQRARAESRSTQGLGNDRRQSTESYTISQINYKGMERENDSHFASSGGRSSQRTHAHGRDSDGGFDRTHAILKRKNDCDIYRNICDLSCGELQRKGRQRQLHIRGPRKVGRSAHSRRSIAPSHHTILPETIQDDHPSMELAGWLGGAPREALEQILGYLDPKDLAALNCTCRYFLESGITRQVARHHLKNVARAKCLHPQAEKGETHVSLLQFVQAQSAAAAQSTAVAMGTYHSVCLLSAPVDDGTESYGMYSFGRGFHGQLGTGSEEQTVSPTLIKNVERQSVTELYQGSKNDIRLAVVHAGSSHSAAISRRGELFMWGLASSGELGLGSWSPTEVTIPRLISNLGKTRVVSVCAGANHTLAISESGQLWSCGRGRHGQLGHGHFHDEAYLSLVDAIQNQRIVSVAAGKFHSMALAADGKLFTWGAGTYGQLGHESNDDMPVPKDVSYLNPSDLLPCDRITAIAAGGYHSVALTVSGHILAAGRNSEGQLGIPSLLNRGVSKFNSVPLGTTVYGNSVYHRTIQVQCGYLHSIALVHVQGRHEVISTGCNTYGQLGIGSQRWSNQFTKVSFNRREAKSITSITSGDWHSGAIAEDGTLYTWGRGDCGQLGHGNDKSRWIPTKVLDFKVVHPDLTLRRSRKAPKEAIVLRSPAPSVKRRRKAETHTNP